MQIRSFVFAKQGKKMTKDKGKTRTYYALDGI
jgi:hypothetical protein